MRSWMPWDESMTNYCAKAIALSVRYQILSKIFWKEKSTIFEFLSNGQNKKPAMDVQSFSLSTKSRACPSNHTRSAMAYAISRNSALSIRYPHTKAMPARDSSDRFFLLFRMFILCTRSQCMRVKLNKDGERIHRHNQKRHMNTIDSNEKNIIRMRYRVCERQFTLSKLSARSMYQCVDCLCPLPTWRNSYSYLIRTHSSLGCVSLYACSGFSILLFRILRHH